MEEKIVDSFIIKQHNEIAELKNEIELLTKRWKKLKRIVKKKVDNLTPPNWCEWEEMQGIIQELEKVEDE